MLIPFGKPRQTTCDGISRRHMLRLGASGLIGGLTLPRLLELQAKAPAVKPAKAQACIFIFLEGGPSQLDMWDMKPDAPAEVRGPFKPIRTNVTGTMISEHLPRCAKMANKYTIVRSHSHNDNGHNTGYHYVMTGYKADFADGNSRVPPPISPRSWPVSDVYTAAAWALLTLWCSERIRQQCFISRARRGRCSHN